MKLLDGVIDSMDMSLSKLWQMVEDREDWSAAVHGVLRVGHARASEQPKRCGMLFSKAVSIFYVVIRKSY